MGEAEEGGDQRREERQMSPPTALFPGLATKPGGGEQPQHLVLSLPGMSSDLQRAGQK